MDVICGRKTVGRTTGDLLANGRPICKSTWSRVVSSQHHGHHQLACCLLHMHGIQLECFVTIPIAGSTTSVFLDQREGAAPRQLYCTCFHTHGVICRTLGFHEHTGTKRAKLPCIYAQVGYVEQIDVHTPAQTVREALWFSGRLRLGGEVSDEQVRQ
jgi:hypothetical protein